ncbi:hypothetical protein NQ317_005443 [Molorchus minor]|uniref:Uncharacterized protein n=1 Tax=Molorchus minor TaxID=1323400 RepID=A0ABQ9JHT9_9CUCU|nr:hypothetical protein NQ317_005443 [Molorchus minor]
MYLHLCCFWCGRSIEPVFFTANLTQSTGEILEQDKFCYSVERERKKTLGSDYVERFILTRTVLDLVPVDLKLLYTLQHWMMAYGENAALAFTSRWPSLLGLHLNRVFTKLTLESQNNTKQKNPIRKTQFLGCELLINSKKDGRRDAVQSSDKIKKANPGLKHPRAFFSAWFGVSISVSFSSRICPSIAEERKHTVHRRAIPHYGYFIVPC